VLGTIYNIILGDLMKKSTLFKLAVMGIAASSGASSTAEGSDLSNLSEASNIVVSGCGGKSGCGHNTGSGSTGYYNGSQGSSTQGCNSYRPSQGCNSRSSQGCSSYSASQGTSTQGCNSRSSQGCNSRSQSTPVSSGSHGCSASSVRNNQTAQPTTVQSTQQTTGSRYQYERTTNTPVTPVSPASEQEKLRLAAEKAKQDATKNAAQQSPTNVPNNSMVPNSRAPNPGTGAGYTQNSGSLPR